MNQLLSTMNSRVGPRPRKGFRPSVQQSKQFAAGIIYRHVKPVGAEELEFLMVTYHSDPERPPCLKFPGGGEKNTECDKLKLTIPETPEQTFQRELLEETGLTPAQGFYERVFKFEEANHTRYFFLVHKRTDIPELILSGDQENIKIDWHGLDEILQPRKTAYYHLQALDHALLKLDRSDLLSAALERTMAKHRHVANYIEALRRRSP